MREVSRVRRAMKYTGERVGRVPCERPGPMYAFEEEDTPMRTKLTISCVAISFLPLPIVSPQRAVAQVNVQVQIAVPTIRFETAPVLVEVTPGVQVVQDYDQEVFFVDGWYWYRSGPRWYQTRDHRGGWVVVQERSVPPTLVRIPRGKYKHYKARGPHPHAISGGTEDPAGAMSSSGTRTRTTSTTGSTTTASSTKDRSTGTAEGARGDTGPP